MDLRWKKRRQIMSFIALQFLPNHSNAAQPKKEEEQQQQQKEEILLFLF